MVFITIAAAEDLHDDIRRDACHDSQINEDKGLFEIAFSLEAAVMKAQDAGEDSVALDEDLAGYASDYGYLGR